MISPPNRPARSNGSDLLNNPHLIPKLSGKREIARGAERQVFTVKKSPDVLVKIMRAKHLGDLAGLDDRSLSGWLKLRRTYGLYRREQRVWTDAMLRAAIRQALPPLAAVSDFVLTPQGLGQIVERVRDEDGATAPTLTQILAKGPLTPAHQAALNRFIGDIYDWHIVAYDISPDNIVWEADGARFLLIDGFGDRSILPLKTWIKRLNDRRLDRAFAKMCQKAGLRWNAKMRTADV